MSAPRPARPVRVLEGGRRRRLSDLEFLAAIVLGMLALVLLEIALALAFGMFELVRSVLNV